MWYFGTESIVPSISIQSSNMIFFCVGVMYSGEYDVCACYSECISTPVSLNEFVDSYELFETFDCVWTQIRSIAWLDLRFIVSIYNSTWMYNFLYNMYNRFVQFVHCKPSITYVIWNEMNIVYNMRMHVLYISVYSRPRFSVYYISITCITYSSLNQ
jgi:hypothetical protein